MVPLKSISRNIFVYISEDENAPTNPRECAWLEVVQRDCQVRGLSRDDAMDDAMVRGRWRKMIRMVDEQEGCEWMNVSSGTGSPR